MKIKLLMGIVVILMASCTAPQATQPQAASSVSTATRARAVQPTPTVEAQITATATPTVAPSATATTSPSPTDTPIQVLSQTASVTASATSSPASSAASGVLLAINPNKYPTPSLLMPDNNTTYHVSQPVVHLAWSATPTDLMTFGQTPGCVSGSTNLRRAFESYQLVIHSLDAKRADQVQWTENSTGFDLNLTTLPQGRYSWSVNIITVCESYVVGQRNKTITRSFVGQVSPTSATQIINWVP